MSFCQHYLARLGLPFKFSFPNNTQKSLFFISYPSYQSLWTWCSNLSKIDCSSCSISFLWASSSPKVMFLGLVWPTYQCLPLYAVAHNLRLHGKNNPYDHEKYEIWSCTQCTHSCSQGRTITWSSVFAIACLRPAHINPSWGARCAGVLPSISILAMPSNAIPKHKHKHLF